MPRLHVSFANTGIKHATIAMADVGARALHTGICTFRAQALSIGTSIQSGPCCSYQGHPHFQYLSVLGCP